MSGPSDDQSTQGFTPGSGVVVPGEGPTTRIGPYRLMHLLGEGGFGSVYLAEQEEPVHRQVALKILKAGMDTKQIVARFEQERQALALMDHPNIAQVFDAGVTPAGRPYFVMERVEGLPITRYCDDHGLSLRQRLVLFAQVCKAIQHAHQKGIIHRDIKPSNVLVATLDGQPHAKVIDFGLAKATEASFEQLTLFTELGHVIGTPAYMSPEQAEGNPDIDTRTDVYSLGVLLYELLSGALPFDPRTLRYAAAGEVQRLIREVDPPRPSARLSDDPASRSLAAQSRGLGPGKLAAALRGELDWIVMMALEKDRRRRYPTANGLGMDIERFLAGEPVLAAPPSASYRLRKFVTRHRGAVAAAGLVLLALVGGIAGTTAGLAQALRARRAEAAAKVEAQRQAEVARAVNEFLTHDLLSAADPTRTRNRQITVREVVDQAAARVGQRFGAAPLVGASIERALGVLYTRLGEYDAAGRHLGRAHDLLMATRGERDRDTLDVRGSLDDLYKQTGRIEEGVKALEATVPLMQAALGPDDPVTLANRTRLGTLYAARGEFGRAEDLFRDTWERQKRVLGPAHRDLGATINELANSYMQQQQFDKAAPLLEEVLGVLKAASGADDPDALEVALNLGWSCQELGQTAKAEALTAKALEDARRVLGDEHPTTQLGINNLGVIYNRSGRPELAEPLYRESLEVARRTLGPEHPDLVPSLNNLGKLYVGMKKFAQAEPLLAEAVGKARKVLPKGFKRGAVLLTYGGCLLGLDRAGEARRTLAEAREEMLVSVPPEHPGVQKATALLADASARVGDARAAAGWRARLTPPKSAP